jgi:NAD(P)-dependent dehydrogenase (short-subunit alcohol dehydrogenase family)
MTAQLSGVHALVTGGTSGIGRSTALAFAKNGAVVAISGRNAERGAQVVREIEAAGGKAEFIANDLHDAESARRLANEAIARLGQVDVLVNNAGVYPFGPTETMTEADFDSVFDLNVRAPYFLVAELAPKMADRGKGAIVNVSTMVAEYGNVGTSLYGASKAAIVSLTKTWAAEYGPRGVRVNAVSPGPTYTEGTEALGEGLNELVGPAPAGRPGQADEIADAIVFLASDHASYIHGATIPVDGGRTAV